MDSFFQSQSSFASTWSYESLENFRQISPTVQSHLKSNCELLLRPGWLTTLGCFGCIAWLFSVPTYEERKRFGLLMAAGLLEGASVGTLIELAIEFDPSILVTAFVWTALAFGCFSAAAIIARHREFLLLYLGDLLSSGLSNIRWFHFAAPIFGHSSVIFEVVLGLCIFLAYITVTNAQEIMEIDHPRNLDYWKHLFSLFASPLKFAFGCILSVTAPTKACGGKQRKKKWQFTLLHRTMRSANFSLDETEMSISQS